MHMARWVNVIVLFAALAACTGETARESLPTADGGPTAPEADGAAAAAVCSATGAAADCDPVTGSGCGTGTCYLVRNQGPSCVCEGDRGTVVEGSACDTTTECGGGLVCAGTKAPGVCRKTCDPNGTAGCLGGSFCRTITAFPTYGYCDTNNN